MRDGAVVVVVPLPPSYRGGTEEYAYRVAVRVGRERPVRIVTTTVRWEDGGHALDVGGLPLEPVRAVEVFQRPLVVGPAARGAIRRSLEGAALVHLHMPFPFVERAVARWAETHAVPTVYTYHMDADFGSASRLPGAGLVTRAYRGTSARPALDRCSAVVSNSWGYAKASPVLSAYLPKVRVIAKGVDPARLGLTPGETSTPPRPSSPSDLYPGAGSSTRRIAFVGRLVPYKGLPILIRAVAELARSGEDAALYIAGRGPQREELERLVSELDVRDRVRFLGFLPDERLGEFYRSADVVACPSVSLLESTATCLEEASACGVPILGSDLPGTSETVPNDGEHGVLVPPNDVRGVADGLRHLLRRPRPASRLPFRTWDDTARDYLSLYRELIGSARAAS
jgi:glycosyltransferase involved in cell wall biosynthesis